jgi:hypothetical protein
MLVLIMNTQANPNHPHQRRYFAFSAILLCLMWLLAGCGSSVTRAPIKVQVQSAIDINDYSNFAVLPFAESKHSDTRQIKVSEEIGEEISALTRIGLGRYQNINVTSTQETMRMLTGEEIDEDTISDVDWLVRFGRYFEADAVITGTYSFFVMSEPRRYYGERYDSRLQRYVTDYQDYLQKTYILSLRIKMINVETETVIWDEEYQRSAVEAHSLGSFLVSQAMPYESVLKNLSKQAIAEFTRKVSPHYEVEERFLVR